ncbi:flagellar hook-associated 2 C-terminus family protein, putative [Babesia ovis]|uniref:Flagellar hook-associated 2 C-terminus family protein, putative n=1 Tax=Babesia ovis TaxID=5869 RepID=A0A9W5WTD7_BABOV|nr:flagellar hook-associated 2 C-terminus family protein, putative [Babesia ovis]
MSYNKGDKLPDPYSNYVIYVNPLQYARICLRRAQRDRILQKRGRPAPSYVPLAVRYEPPTFKRGRQDFEASGQSYGYVGYPPQSYGMYSDLRYSRGGEYAHSFGKMFRSNDGIPSKFTDAAAMIAGPKDQLGYSSGAVSSSSRSHPSGYNSPTSGSPSGRVAMPEGFSGDLYALPHPSSMESLGSVQQRGSMESIESLERTTSESYSSGELYAPMPTRFHNIAQLASHPNGLSAEGYSPSSSSGQDPVPSASRVIPQMSRYSSIDDVLSKGSTGTDYYVHKLGSTVYTNGSYSAETYSGDSCSSESHSKDGCISSGDGRDFYPPNASTYTTTVTNENGRNDDSDGLLNKCLDTHEPTNDGASTQEINNGSHNLVPTNGQTYAQDRGNYGPTGHSGYTDSMDSPTDGAMYHTGADLEPASDNIDEVAAAGDMSCSYSQQVVEGVGGY